MIRYFVRTRDFPDAADRGRVLSVAHVSDEGDGLLVDRWDHEAGGFIDDISILGALMGLGGETDWASVSKEEAEAAETDLVSFVERGGPGSGHFGHEGRPGEVGGSLPGQAQAETETHLAGAGERALNRPLPPEIFKLARHVSRTTLSPDQAGEFYGIERGWIVGEDGLNPDVRVGTADHITFSREDLVSGLNGKWLVHNHPSGRGLSMEDMTLAINARLAGMIATGTSEEGDPLAYVFIPPTASRSISDVQSREDWITFTFLPLYHAAERAARLAVLPRYNAGMLDNTQAWRAHIEILEPELEGLTGAQGIDADFGLVRLGK